MIHGALAIPDNHILKADSESIKLELDIIKSITITKLIPQVNRKCIALSEMSPADIKYLRKIVRKTINGG